MGAIHFGTSSVHEAKVRHLHDYFKMIDRTLGPIFDASGDPLILAAVSRELAMYRKVNTYPGLMEPSIQGSPDALSKACLYDKAMELMAVNPGFRLDQFQRELETAVGRKLLVTDPATIHRAAQQGQVQRLFVAADQGPNEDVANSLAVAVIRNSGRVVCAKGVEITGGIAAVLRYRQAEASPQHLMADATAR